MICGCTSCTYLRKYLRRSVICAAKQQENPSCEPGRQVQQWKVWKFEKAAPPCGTQVAQWFHEGAAIASAFGSPVSVPHKTPTCGSASLLLAAVRNEAPCPRRLVAAQPLKFRPGAHLQRGQGSVPAGGLRRRRGLAAGGQAGEGRAHGSRWSWGGEEGAGNHLRLQYVRVPVRAGAGEGLAAARPRGRRRKHSVAQRGAAAGGMLATWEVSAARQQKGLHASSEPLPSEAAAKTAQGTRQQ